MEAAKVARDPARSPRTCGTGPEELILTPDGDERLHQAALSTLRHRFAVHKLPVHRLRYGSEAASHDGCETPLPAGDGDEN